jgi:dTDP-4-amino-4,6-dideoxygalactose transaminase
MLPDITEAEINEVVEIMKSNWITTGPKTKLFEKALSAYCNASKAACINSATNGLKILLDLLQIGKGDEIILTPYTFASTANEIIHHGAKPVFVDILKNDFNIDPDKIKKAITKKTKVVIPTDIGGMPCNYDEITEVLNVNKKKYNPKKNTLQSNFDKPIIIADSAHSLGASYKNKKIGSIVDFTIFSFHATKNLTTAEGGAILFNDINNINSEEIYKQLMMLSLHGMNKDAFAKIQAASWEYAIEFAGHKCNMPDILAGIGLAQLKRYDSQIIPKRKKLFEYYYNRFKNNELFINPPFDNDFKKSSYHLFMLRINNADESKRNLVINKMAENNIACNVHFIPIVMHPYYKKLGFNINDYPNTYNMYKNEITLPFYSTMKEKDAEYVADKLLEICKELSI